MQSIIDFYQAHYLEILSQEPWKSWVEHNNTLLREYGASSIRLYSYQFDRVINNGIRSKRLSESGFLVLTRIINLLSKARPIPTDLFLFRGVTDVPAINVSNLASGNTFTDPGFMSKSINPNIAYRFAGENCCLLTIGYKANGVPMILSEEITEGGTLGEVYGTRVKGEYEFLTYPGEILSVENVFNYSTILRMIHDYVTGNQVPVTFDTKAISSTLSGFQYSQLPDDILPLVDLSIDQTFRNIMSAVIEALKTTNYVCVLFNDKHVVFLEYLPEIKQSLFYDKFYSFNLNMIEFFLSFYAKFLTTPITNIVAVYGYNPNINLVPSIPSVYQYREIYPKELIAYSVFSKALSDNLTKLGDIQFIKLNVDYKIPDNPVRIQGNETLPILELEQQFKQYPKAYGDKDPVIYNYLSNGLLSNEFIREL